MCLPFSAMVYLFTNNIKYVDFPKIHPTLIITAIPCMPQKLKMKVMGSVSVCSLFLVVVPLSGCFEKPGQIFEDQDKPE